MTVTKASSFGEVLKSILKNYFAILEKRAKPKFFYAKQEHLLDEKILKAYECMQSCKLCERKCCVNRKVKITQAEVTQAEALKALDKATLGYCQIGNKMCVSSWFAHYGEESFFVPSFTIFFWGCNFRCVFCQNWTISQRYEPPIMLSPAKLAEIIEQHSYCKNINFVGGEPTPQLPFILETLKHTRASMPVIWNSNFYMSREAMNLLSGIVDVYLSDFKYGNDECALKLSNVMNYVEIVKRNHLLASKDAELVVRHLVLPGHVDCCTKPILKWLAKIKDKAIINIMDQYRPDFLVLKERAYKELRRSVSPTELEEVINYAKRLRLNFIF
ncbi:MAG: radical SAM protein [Candidatus Pacearchaeota archaeon]